MWLDEIVKSKWLACNRKGQIECLVIDGINCDRMAHVIGELVTVIDKYRQTEGRALFHIYISDCSNDAKELFNE